MCVLHVTSQFDSLASFLEGSGLPSYEAHEKGEPIFPLAKDAGEYVDAGFSCVVSEKDWDDLQGQIDDAITFLQQYEKQLLDLVSRYNITDIRLDFPLQCRNALDENMVCQSDYFSPELLRFAGRLGIGIELSRYQ